MAETTPSSNSAQRIATIVYALQTAGFFVGLTFLVAVVISYMKRDVARGTWVASHFRWQIGTFWGALIGNLIGIATAFILVGYLVLLATWMWMIYRVAKGWFKLADNRPMYADG